MPIIAGTETRVNTTTDNIQAVQQVAALEGGGWVVTWLSAGQDGDNLGVYQQAYAADGTPEGSETQVNTFTTSEQASQQITALDDGGWVVTWMSAGQDGSGYGVYQQAYTADGTPQGGETQVNTFTAGDNQHYPEITALDGGGWVVTWGSPGQDGSGHGVYQQAYAANGTPQGGEARVNSYTTSDQSLQQITALDGGGWVVTWQSFGQNGSSYGVYQQAYAANGTPQGGETRVNTYTTSDQSAQQITALDGGGWVVTWMSFYQDGSNYGVYQQAYAADGTPEGGETRVNTFTTGLQSDQKVAALDGGGWVASWSSFSQDGSDHGVYQQIYAADGTPVGGETQVNTFTASSQYFRQITALDGGGWVVTWQSADQDGDGYGIYQQAYAADGTPEGGETQINTFTANNQLDPQIVALNDGGWVVTWQSFGQDGDGWGIYHKTFHINDAPVLAGAIVDQVATEEQAFSFVVPDGIFTDTDDTLSYTATLDGGDPLPAWLEFDAATRTFSGTPDDADTGVIEIVVTASDGSNPGVSDTFTLIVGGVSDAPEGTDATITIAEDTARTFTAADFGFNDADGDALSAVIITTLPMNGRLRLDGVLVVAGQSIAAADLDGLAWKPAKNANGDALASLSFQVVDDGGDTDQSANTITFDVTEVAERRIGGFSDDTINGTDDDDILRGRQGNDILRGKGGDDNLRSIGGNDRLVGGTGADTFVFSTKSDRDTITDFETGIDHIDLSRWKAIDDFAEVRSHARNHGDDVWITAGHDTLVIHDMKKVDLQAGDFVF